MLYSLLLVSSHILKDYCIANNVTGGVKHWRIWRIFGGSPIFNPLKHHVKSLYNFWGGLHNTWYQRRTEARLSRFH